MILPEDTARACVYVCVAFYILPKHISIRGSYRRFQILDARMATLFLPVASTTLVDPFFSLGK